MVETISQLLLVALAIATTPPTSTDMPPQEGVTRMSSPAKMVTTTEKVTSLKGNSTSGAPPWCPVLEQDSEELGVMGRLARLDELQKMKELVEAEIRAVKASIS